MAKFRVTDIKHLSVYNVNLKRLGVGKEGE